MSERAKIITLAILLAAAVGVAAWRLGLLGPKKGAEKVPEPTAAAVPAPAVPPAGRLELPESKVLDEIAVWVNAPPVEEMPGGVPGRFGVPLPQDAQGTQSVAAASDETARVVVPTVAAIIAVAGELKASIGGRTYACGDAIPGSGCRITDITPKTVTFEDNRGFIHKATLLQ